jgi:hypothetical protein
MSDVAVLEQLIFARQIADHAHRLGVLRMPLSSRPASDHMGAVLADAILQAGVNYQTVVRVRMNCKSNTTGLVQRRSTFGRGPLQPQ